MRKFVLLAFSFLVLCFADTNTQKKIESNKSSLRSTEVLTKQLNKKLDELASDIINGESRLKTIASDIIKTKEQILTLEGNATATTKELSELNEANKELLRTQKEIEQNIIRIIADDFSLDLILEDDGLDESDDAIISSAILSKLSDVLKDDFKKMAKNYEQTSNLIKEKSGKIESIQSRIKQYQNKQNELIILENNQKKTIGDLKRDKEIYTKKLAKLQTQQEELRKTLEELAIVAKREDEEAKKRAEQQKAQRQNKGKTKEPSGDDNDVRQVGSSYQSSSVKKYSGAKTIAPLDDFVVKQKFGNYVDPIYNIKIFNESVVLRSKTPDAKVKSVLNGKVVFAKQTQLLDKVVIIENDSGIHTIYAHLSQIAPTIKVGTRVQKGYVIGRVRDELTFEVTQKNYHIDPLEMISLK